MNGYRGTKANRSKPVYALLGAALLALVVMPIAFAGAAEGGQQGVRKQLRQLKQRIATLEARQDPTSLPPSGPASGDLSGSYPNPLLRTAAVGAGELADNAVTAPKIAAGAVGTLKLADSAVETDKINGSAVTSAKIATEAVQASDMALDSVGAYSLEGVVATVGTGATVTAGNPNHSSVTCPLGQMLIAGGYAWSDAEANSIIASAPSETDPNRTWVVEGMVDAGSNTLYAWATCIKN